MNLLLQASLLLPCLLSSLQEIKGRPQIVHWNEVGSRHPPFVHHTALRGPPSPSHSKDKCEIEIFTRGSCIVNNNRLKPQVILNFEHKQYSPDGNGSPLPASNQPINRQDVNLNKWRIANNDLNLKRMIANEFVVRFVDMMKREYGHQFEPLVIQETQFVKLKHWGDANIYDLKIFGLKHLQPLETKLLEDGDSGKPSQWRFTSILHVANLTAHFKVDANVNNKIVIKHWQLMLLMERCQLLASFEIDFAAQVLKINSMHLKSFDNFQLISETLSWPFNEIVSSIVNEEKYYIKNVIELNAQKYINMTLSQHFDLNAIMDKIMRNS